jgi:hypothetical protein
MNAWLERAMPPIALHLYDPLFKYEIRRVRWGQTQHQLTSYSLLILWLVPILVLGLWMLLLDNVGSYYARDTFIGLLLIFGIGANFLLDMVSLTAALHSVSSDMRAGRWDVLRLTDLDAQQFVGAKYALAQVRAWRVMALVMSLRISLIAFLVIRLELLPVVLVLAGYGLVYILEPLWRMRALVALGLAIATRLRNMTYALIAGLSAMLVMWAAQSLFVLIVVSWLGASIPALICFEPLILVAAGWWFYAFCRGLQTRALRHAARHAFAQD